MRVLNSNYSLLIKHLVDKNTVCKAVDSLYKAKEVIDKSTNGNKFSSSKL